jgi:hypothetical protein
MNVLMHWQVGVKLHEMNPGTERDRLTRFVGNIAMEPK